MVLTGGVGVVHKVHLEGVTVVEDAHSVIRVVLQLQGLQRRVEHGLFGDDVNGRLSGTVRHWILLCPFVWTCFPKTHTLFNSAA